MVLLLGKEDTPHKATHKTTNVSFCINLTHLKTISSFTLKVSIASYERKCTNKWTNGLITIQERHVHIKKTSISIYNNLTHLNIISWFKFKFSIDSNKSKCTKKWTNGLIAWRGRHTHPHKALKVVFALTWHTWKRYPLLHWKSQ